MIISSLIFFDASFHKSCLFWEMFSYSFSIIRKRKKRHNTSTYKTKIVLSAALLRFNYCSPFAIYVIQMNCFGPKKAILLACYVDGKAGYATFKVKMLLLKRNHNQQQSLFNYFPRKTNGFQPDFICNILFT
jgi:hypothetical protein